MQIKCPLCCEIGSRFYEEKFYACSNCMGIFLCPDFLPNRDREKQRYEKHNNDVFDEGYRNFVKPITNAVIERFMANHQGLDFGAGPGSAVSAILQENNFQIKQYDPFFHDHLELLEQNYDYVVCCEVAEHFHNPAKEFTLLKKLLKPNASLIGMTEFYNPRVDFKTWHYKNDETHVFFYQKETLEWIKVNFGFSDLECSERVFVMHA